MKNPPSLRDDCKMMKNLPSPSLHLYTLAESYNKYNLRLVKFILTLELCNCM